MGTSLRPPCLQGFNTEVTEKLSALRTTRSELRREARRFFRLPLATSRLPLPATLVAALPRLVERLVETELHGATEKGSLEVGRYLAWARYNPDQAAGIESSEDNL